LQSIVDAYKPKFELGIITQIKIMLINFLPSLPLWQYAVGGVAVIGIMFFFLRKGYDQIKAKALPG